MMILGALIGLELRGWPLPGAADAPVPPPARAAPTVAPAAPTEAWVATILARPLFDASRAAPAAKAAPATGLPRLAGIMVTPEHEDAVFAPASGPAVVTAVGGHVGPYTVRSIGRDSVVVEGPTGLTILHTSFASGGAGNNAAPAPAPFSAIPGITGTPGGIWLDNGKADLPNAATWPGPPPLALPGAAPPAAPAASPPLTPPGAG